MTEDTAHHLLVALDLPRHRDRYTNGDRGQAATSWTATASAKCKLRASRRGLLVPPITHCSGDDYRVDRMARKWLKALCSR